MVGRPAAAGPVPVEPVELTLQVGVTRAAKGSAGIKWHVLALGGERSREAVSTQTLKLRLAPVLFDEQGNALAEAEQLISDRDDSPARAAVMRRRMSAE